MSNSRKTLAMFPLLGALVGASGACASTSAVAWHEVASAAQLLGPDQLAAADKALSGLTKEQRGIADPALDAIAALPPGLDAMHAAGQKILDTSRALSATEGDVAGTPRSVAAFQGAADCVLHGLVYRSGQAVGKGPDPDKTALNLLMAVRRELAVFPEGSSGHLIAPDWVENELRLGLGPPVYDRAVKAATATP